jgi:hypothetical protein
MKETMNLQSTDDKMDSSNSSYGSETSLHDINSSTENEYANATAEVRKATKGETLGYFWSSLVLKIKKIIVAISLTMLVYGILQSSETKQFHTAVSVLAVNFFMIGRWHPQPSALFHHLLLRAVVSLTVTARSS